MISDRDNGGGLRIYEAQRAPARKGVFKALHAFRAVHLIYKPSIFVFTV